MALGSWSCRSLSTGDQAGMTDSLRPQAQGPVCCLGCPSDTAGFLCTPGHFPRVTLGSRLAHPRPPPLPLLLVNSVSSPAAEPWGGRVVVACRGDSRTGLSHMGLTEP